MAKKGKQVRQRPDTMRKFKKKTSPLVIEKVEYVDYKDVDLLSRFMTDRAKIRNQKLTGNNRQQQLEIANAIKNAREMALLPYSVRVASAPRGGRGRDDRRPRDGEHEDSGREGSARDDQTLDGASHARPGDGVDVDVKVDIVDDGEGHVGIAETVEEVEG